jgi:CRP-like cAMP-binding protein/DNA-binding NarL/FixJ family response regulator
VNPTIDVEASPKFLEGMRVLLFDATTEEGAQVASVLGENGASITVVTTTDEALAVFERQAPDVVIATEATAANTIALVRALRGHPSERGSGVPFVAIGPGGGERERLLEAGVDVHLARGAGRSEVVSALTLLAAKCARLRELRAELARMRREHRSPSERPEDRHDRIEREPRRLAEPVERRGRAAVAAPAPALSAAFGTRLLDALPEVERDHVAPRLRPSTVEQGQTLCAAGLALDVVYFPRSCLVSLMCVIESGKTFEVATAGADGFIGLPVLLGSPRGLHWAVGTIAGEAWTLTAEELTSAVDACPTLRRMLLRFAHEQLLEASQVAACTRAHPVRAQLARWLLTASDRVGSTLLTLTHEAISERLGTRRASVSLALEAFQKERLLSTRSGRIRIESRAGLEHAACECYWIVRDAFSCLYEGL